jgi:hypothetical protein
MGKTVQFTVTVSSQSLLDDFKSACRKRQMKYSVVVSSAMRYFVQHPHSSGWGNGNGESGVVKKQKTKAA